MEQTLLFRHHKRRQGKRRSYQIREKTGRPKGGVTGHVKTEMAVPKENEITDTEEHLLDENDVCPNCKGEDFKYTGETVDRYETEVEVKAKKQQLQTHQSTPETMNVHW